FLPDNLPDWTCLFLGNSLQLGGLLRFLLSGHKRSLPPPRPSAQNAEIFIEPISFRAIVKRAYTDEIIGDTNDEAADQTLLTKYSSVNDKGHERGRSRLHVQRKVS